MCAQVHQAQFAHLCTVMSGMHHRRAGYPFGTLVDFAADEAGYPIFCLSPLAIHTRNIMEDPRCSLVVQMPGWTGGDTLLETSTCMYASTGSIALPLGTTPAAEATSVGKHGMHAGMSCHQRDIMHPVAALLCCNGGYLLLRLRLLGDPACTAWCKEKPSTHASLPKVDMMRMRAQA
jgi:hypothetical protein